jgi:hypothetical protein
MRALLYGADGRTPIATEFSVEERLLVEAFGLASGATVAKCRDQAQMQDLLQEQREYLVAGILALPGMQERIEARYDLKIERTPDGPEPGQVVEQNPDKPWMALQRRG